MSDDDEVFMPLRRAAGLLGVPITWLKEEAEAGRVPSLMIGRRRLFNLEAVEHVLVERARDNGVGTASRNGAEATA